MAPSVSRDKATPSQSTPKSRLVPVVAIKTGYFKLRRIREGQQFQYPLEEGQDLPRWVEPLSARKKQAVEEIPEPPGESDADKDVL